MNVIFGSGIVGLLARMMLGDSWTVVPFYKSRFFSFNPALDDNFIITDEVLDPFIKDLQKVLAPKKYVYTRAWSVQGQLVKKWDEALCKAWLIKVFGNEIPPQAEPYLMARMNLTVYDIRVNLLYQSLQNMYMKELVEESKKGSVTEIGDHYFIRGGIRHEFDHAVNTIPLDTLLKLSNLEVELQAKTVHYFHIETDALDFEGMNQVLVVDKEISFFKVSNVAPNRYLIYAHEEIPNPGVYFMAFMGNFEILDGTTLENVIPLGTMPKLKILEKYGIFSVGSYAQWDWCMDVGSCILRTLRYSERGNKPGGKSSKC